jgi:hypothetical protein
MLIQRLAWLSCPDCAAGRAARSLVISDAFWFRLWCVVLPFVVTALVVRAILRRIDRDDATRRMLDRRSR